MEVKRLNCAFHFFKMPGFVCCIAFSEHWQTFQESQTQMEVPLNHLKKLKNTISEATNCMECDEFPGIGMFPGDYCVKYEYKEGTKVTLTVSAPLGYFSLWKEEWRKQTFPRLTGSQSVKSKPWNKAVQHYPSIKCSICMILSWETKSTFSLNAVLMARLRALCTCFQ